MSWQKITRLKALKHTETRYSGRGPGKRGGVRSIGGGTANVTGEIFLSYDIPEIAILLRPPEEMCKEICETIAERIKGGIRSGRDIHGRSIALKPRTLEARVEDSHPPKQTFSGYSMLRKRMEKKGATFNGRLRGTITRSYTRKQGSRWERLYPGGPSKGGSTPFYSSGFLHDSVRVEAPFKVFQSGSRGAFSVAYSRKRRAAVVSRERRGIELVGIPQGVMEDALEKELEAIISPMGGVEGMRGSWVGIGLGSVLRGVGRGFGV